MSSSSSKYHKTALLKLKRILHLYKGNEQKLTDAGFLINDVCRVCSFLTFKSMFLLFLKGVLCSFGEQY